MKKTLAAALLLTVLSMGLPYFVVRPDNALPETSPPAQAEKLQEDTERTVTVLVADTPCQMTVRDYLVGVVAAETPASFEPEALKAQAVAARSYLQYLLRAGSKHEGADICSSFSCCQAYLDDNALRENWGDNYESYIAKIREAVDKTDGEYLSYEGEPVLAAFHSCSGGTTENSGAIWGDLPYLESVDTPETADNVPNLVTTLTLPEIDFRDTILYLKPEADMTGDAGTWVGEPTLTASGRVDSMMIGNVAFTGSELRTLFSLRSTDFSIEHRDNAFVFTVTGYGHGIGMSQYGANIMAKNGADYKEILAHYYPGTTI